MRLSSRFLSLAALLGALAGCVGLFHSTKPQVQDIAWVGISSKDNLNTARFFRDILELPVLQERQGVIDFGLPSGQIFSVFDNKQVQLVTGPFPLVGFGVDDIANARRYFRKRGLQFVDRIQGRWRKDPAKWTHFQDPQGHFYELNQDTRHLDAQWIMSPTNRLGIMSIAFVGMPAPDAFPETAKTFHEILQLEPLDIQTPFQMALFALPSGRLFEVMGPDVPDVSITNYALIGFEVHNLYEALRTLKKRGVTIIGEPRDQGPIAWFYFQGPEGLIYEIIEIRQNIRSLSKDTSKALDAPMISPIKNPLTTHR